MKRSLRGFTWKWAFAALAFAEVAAVPLVVRGFGFGLCALTAAALLVANAAVALRCRDACVRAEALEQFLTVVGAARLQAEGET